MGGSIGLEGSFPGRAPLAQPTPPYGGVNLDGKGLGENPDSFGLIRGPRLSRFWIGIDADGGACCSRLCVVRRAAGSPCRPATLLCRMPVRAPLDRPGSAPEPGPSPAAPRADSPRSAPAPAAGWALPRRV